MRTTRKTEAKCWIASAAEDGRHGYDRQAFLDNNVLGMASVTPGKSITNMMQWQAI